MATLAALLPATPMAHAPPISVSSSTPATLSPSLSVTPSGPSLFRSELLSSASPGIPIGSLPHKPVYSTPSPVENTPQNNECKMVEVRGARLASFTVNGNELICLPQAFDLFLKHLVGGLHTVYTKLKRLEITPVVCNVEQVRILRGLGAIQPGVNRCKLISRKDFEVLYNDCTNASDSSGMIISAQKLSTCEVELMQVCVFISVCVCEKPSKKSSSRVNARGERSLSVCVLVL
ncbi:dachshund homolog 1-like [Sinocyclocheilus grahami]|uniref:dachshund homolog 1-like n=1 Tax=Sinocyclocheilus grahami TaxID=75366 RepID=UPI0007ACA1B3|nr:PREDICTED: dachshund homolog 1-like [Sinocyclocheilus grahami]